MKHSISACCVAVLTITAPISVAHSMSQAKEVWLIEEAKKAVRATMKDPDSAKFAGLKAIDDPPVVCGTVNGKNAFGGYAGPERFLSNGSGITYLESDMNPAEFSKAWNQICK